MLFKNKNIKLLLNYVLGPILFIWLSCSIWRQTQNQPNFNEALHQLKNAFKGTGVWKLLAVIMLMLINWSLEARKWQLLLKPLEKMPFLKAFKAVLAGIAFSVNTPNRIGEYGGRMLYVQNGHRWQAVSLTIVGSLSQLIITLLMGMGGLLFLLKNQPLAIATKEYSLLLWVLFYGTSGAHLLLLLFYFKLETLARLLEKIPRTSSLVQRIAILEQLPVTILLRVLFLSAIRYIVFVIQYIILLQLFGVIITVPQAFWLVAVLYLVLAVIPSIALAEIGIRGEVSKLLFGLLSTNVLGIMVAAISIWFINLILPAIAGSLLFLGTKIIQDR